MEYRIYRTWAALLTYILPHIIHPTIVNLVLTFVKRNINGTSNTKKL